MLKNYLKVALRNLAKNRTYVLINLFGLGAAVATCIIGYLNFQYDADFDKNHQNRDSVFFIKTVSPPEKGGHTWGYSPMPMGPELKREFSQVEKMTRCARREATVKTKDFIFSENVVYAEPDFPEMFTLTLQKGSWNAFKSKNEVVLNEKMAKKYFFGTDPIGKPFTLILEDEKRYEMTVGAVVEELPLNSTFYFDILVDFELYLESRNYKSNDWRLWGYYTFFQVKDPAFIPELEVQMDKYLPLQHEGRPDWKASRFEFTPLATLSRGSRDLNGYRMFHEQLPPSSVISPLILALFILLIACFNFVNTSIAVSGNRLKEISLRKILGGSRSQLVTQLMSENMILCFAALLVGMGLAEFLVPAYSNLWPFLDIELNYAENVPLILFLVGLLCFTAILAGAYPALYISSFEPVAILRGTQKFGSNSLLSKVLLTFQFSLSIVVVVMGIAFTQNATFIQQADLGFDIHKILNLRTFNKNQYTVMRDLVEQYPDVEAVTSGEHHIFYSWTGSNIKIMDSQLQTSCLRIQPNYLQTIGVEIFEGESFDPNQPTGQQQKVVLNQTAVKRLGFEPGDVIGKEIIVDSISKTVIGVVKDFYQDGFWQEVEPMTILVTPEEDFWYLALRAEPENIKGLDTWLKGKWEERFPETPYDSFYLSENLLQEAKLVSDNIKFVSAALAIIATLLSIFGLFALVSLSILKRMKEISIRKIFGASVRQITQLIGRPILVVLAIASMLAIPGAWYLVDSIMDSIYDLYLPPEASAFIISIMIVMVLAFFTVGWKVYRAANTNPAAVLRDE